MSMPSTLRTQLSHHIQAQLPELMAIYAFGSRIAGSAHASSDLDLAVLVAGYADPLRLWDLSHALAEMADCAVDLLDLRAASTVMQYQVLTTGERWWARSSEVDLYEAALLSEKTELDTRRSALLRDIANTGVIYGR